MKEMPWEQRRAWIEATYPETIERLKRLLQQAVRDGITEDEIRACMASAMDVIRKDRT